MKAANYSPVYCALYPQLAEITRSHGYALAVHGSMARDFDIVCIPWRDNPSPPQIVVDEITTRFAIRQIHGWTVKHHGREVCTLSIGFGECFADLSFMPRAEPDGQIILIPTYQHVKTGGLYEIVCEGSIESDHAPQVVYRSLDTGKVWIRPRAEFFDGRFKEL
jgi:hypothetical protein